MENVEVIELLKKVNFTRSATTDRYLDPKEVDKELDNLSDRFKREVIGKSVKNRPINRLTWGNGNIKVFIWSQMHGNESTTTRALINLLFFIDEHHSLFIDLYHTLQLNIIPIVNPDGALKLDRYNANLVDLNRDAIDLSQPESKLLMNCYNSIQPDVCFNLHDQRSIFAVNGNFAGMSFLAPSYNSEQSIEKNRSDSMSLIARTVKFLSENGLKGNIGRYDGTFNAKCFGDHFQSRGSTTVLIEAGQLQLDYNRDLSVYYSMLSLLYLLKSLKEKSPHEDQIKNYRSIPMNEKLFYDLLIKNVKINGGCFNLMAKYEIGVNSDGKASYKVKVDRISKSLFPSHRLIDANNRQLTDTNGNEIKQISTADYISNLKINSVNFSIF